MLQPTYFDPHRPFYPIGNSTAVNLAAHLPPEIDVDALLLGCGDVRNILFTLFTESGKGHTAGISRKYHFTCCDLEAGVIARNILILAMIMKNENAHEIWPIYYDFLIQNKYSDTIKKYVDQLLRSAEDINSWSNSDIGRVLKFGSVQSLVAVKRIWEAWKNDLTNKAYKIEIRNTYNRWLEGMNEEFSGRREYIPPDPALALNSYLRGAYRKLFHFYWETGATEKSHRPSLTPNPTFSLPPVEPRFRVDRTTYPPAGFHVATTLVPFAREGTSLPEFRLLAASEDFTPLIQAIKEEFELWCQSFQATHSDGLFTAIFFVDDALELCSSLSQSQSGPFSDQIGFGELNKAMAAAKGYSFNRPAQFNIIDTSNLMDHLGIVNLLLSVLPLLRRDHNSYLNTEAFNTLQIDPNLRDQALLQAFGVDPTSLFSLIGIAPVDYICGLDTISQDRDKDVDCHFTRSRNVWKWVPRFHPEGLQDGEISNLTEFEYDIDAMNAFLATFYASHFTIRAPHTSSATFSLLLQRLKKVTSRSVDWEQLMKQLRFSITLIHGGQTGSFHQEQHTLDHLFGVHTKQLGQVPTEEELAGFNFSDVFRAQRDLETAKKLTHQIKTHEPVTCVTLAVPIETFRGLIQRKKSEIGTPFFHLSISQGGQSQSFSSLRRRMGKLDHAIVLNLDDVNIEKGSPLLIEDPEGWQGKSDVIFSCMVQTCIVLLKDCKVSLEFTPGPHLYAIRGSLPRKIFECSIHDYDNVRLSTKFPSPTLIGRQFTGKGEGANTPAGAKEHKVARKPKIVQNPHKIIFSETENRIERIIPGNSEDKKIDTLLHSRKNPPVHIQFPVGVAHAGSRSVSSWNLHRINLDKSPPVLINLQKYGNQGYEWVNESFKTAFTEQELQHSRGIPTDEASGVNETLVGVKSTIYRMIIGHTGIRQNQSSSYLLQNSTNGGFMFVYIKDLRLDLSANSIVADCGIVPLEESLATAALPKEIENLSEIQVSEKETSAWMQLSVGLVERCRTWVHKPSCEYFVHGRIPLSAPKLTFGMSPICGCGKGIFPKTFHNDPAFKPWASYATRAAIGPIFPPRLP
ncbi:hypothetical protein TWF506_000342 [Arthrobotrys conoides]|uniref:DUF4470 domain-containing protein n=1 Tax=Arthrobotrys conoides TaxID=74498 RepID=A0AAN8RQG5_9PEZI